MSLDRGPNDRPRKALGARQRVDLSVVIPSFGRPQALANLLGCLETQVLPRDRFEVLVVDDGNDPPLDQALPPERLRGITLIRQERAGPAASRNAALRSAVGDLVLFLNDDAVPTPELLEQHLETHRSCPTAMAVLGTFESTAPSYLDRLCEAGGLLFPYESVLPDRTLGPQFFWTCNLSVPRDCVEQAGGFDPTLERPAWDDMELGIRVSRLGVGVRFFPKLRCGHDHPVDLEGLERRFHQLGHEWVAVARKHPATMLSGAWGVPVVPSRDAGHRFASWCETNSEAQGRTRSRVLCGLAVLEKADGAAAKKMFRDQAPSLIQNLRGIGSYHWIAGAAEALLDDA